MRLAKFPFFTFFFIFLSVGKFQFSEAQIDSLWCAKVNEITQCVTRGKILPSVGIESAETYIHPFVPYIFLLDGKNEKIERQDKKVLYTGYILTSKKLDKNLLNNYENWKKKIATCLDNWSLDLLPFTEKKLQPYSAYFFTNSEDETSVRLDLVYEKKQYKIRLRIY